MTRLAERLRPARVALFVTCLGDGFYPEVGEATVRLLHRLGIAVDFPRGQTCYGQPVFKAGSRQLARAVARRGLILCANAEYIVVPSGACAAMWWVLYPELCADDPVLGEQAEAQAARLYELAEFLVQVVGVERLGAVFHGKVTCHASCHTRLAAQRPALIAQVQQELDAARVIATLAYYLLLAQTEGVDPQ